MSFPSLLLLLVVVVVVVLLLLLLLLELLLLLCWGWGWGWVRANMEYNVSASRYGVVRVDIYRYGVQVEGVGCATTLFALSHHPAW